MSPEEMQKELNKISAELNQLGHEAHEAGMEDYASLIAQLRDNVAKCHNQFNQVFDTDKD